MKPALRPTFEPTWVYPSIKTIGFQRTPVLWLGLGRSPSHQLCLFFLFFSFFLHAEKINIISYKNGVGLNQDIEILSEELNLLGHIVRNRDYREHSSRPRADIQIFVEIADDFFFSSADKNYLIPNPEWYVFPPEWIGKFDKILCKTREAERIFKPLNPDTTFISFTSKDRFDPKVKKDYKKALHLVGASIQKSTDMVVSTWIRNPQLPLLSVVKHTGNSELPKVANLELFYKYFSDKELRDIQNQYGLHICPSITEGFGHYIVEALSCGAVVVTTDGAPMNEMVLDERCLVGHMGTMAWRMATCYLPNPQKLQATVENLASFSEEELMEIGRKNREWFVKNDHFFKKRIREVFRPQPTKWQLTDFVWNLGMAAAADFGPYLDPILHFQIYQGNPCRYRAEEMRAGDILWLQCNQVPRFYKEIFPKLKVPVALIISDGDESFPSSVASQIDFEKWISDDRILHIFAQNYDYKGLSHKVSPIPIGIDFHTMAYKSYMREFWGKQASPREQEAVLKKIIESVKPTNRRKRRAFVDFQHRDSMRDGDCKRFLEFGEDRTAIFQRLAATGLIDFSDQMMARSDLWRIKGEYAFSISPPGNGYDCHRTWEDLALGCIVIVKTSPIDRLFDGLPVVIVKDWSEVTEKNMEKWLFKYGDALTNPEYREKLTNRYWLDKIQKKLSDPLIGNLL